MKTFCVQTLGCKVNQYESEQIASLLRSRGWSEAPADRAGLRIINTCSVTVQAASQSRQAVRRAVRLPVVQMRPEPAGACDGAPISPPAGTAAAGDPPDSSGQHPSASTGGKTAHGVSRARVIVTGCWATSDRAAASQLPGVDAVLTHRDDLAAELDRLLTLWQSLETTGPAELQRTTSPALPESMIGNGWMESGRTSAGRRTPDTKANFPAEVNERIAPKYSADAPAPALRTDAPPAAGATRLPILSAHQSGRQRAFLKIQDGCDAACTYCIIPRLRPALWSKPIDDAVQEAQNLVESGHVEIVLTGIFLGAFGQPTALRRRQPAQAAPALAALVEALCTRVEGLKRLRLSSLEPGDLSDDLVRVLRSHPQVVPHFHLPLQSGSDVLLRRMNRQYRRDDFRRMIERVNEAFDRPAITTDVIVGFPGETDAEFDQTLALCSESKFIHIHAFPYSPRPGTAAARWTDQFVHGPVVNQRIADLQHLAAESSLRFRRQFLGQTVEIIVERPSEEEARSNVRHGRCERYFSVTVRECDASAGELLCVSVDRVDAEVTVGLRS